MAKAAMPNAIRIKGESRARYAQDAKTQSLLRLWQGESALPPLGGGNHQDAAPTSLNRVPFRHKTLILKYLYQ